MTRHIAWLLIAVCCSGCMKWDYGPSEDAEGPDFPGRGLMILCEGNFQYGNSTLSYYDPVTRKVTNEIFYKANGFKLGDVGQSVTMGLSKAWIVVNNSHVIFAVNPESFVEQGRITGLTSPRYMHFVSPSKAYVTELWDNNITVVNPMEYCVTGKIEIPGMDSATGSTEQMVQVGDYVYCTAWSYQRSVIRIDSRTDRVTGILEVDSHPISIVMDRADRLWVLCQGNTDASAAVRDNPSLICIDPSTFSIERRFQFSRSSEPMALQTNGMADTLYWVNSDVWRMGIYDTRPPVRPFLKKRSTRYFGLTVDPERGDVYVADAVDYQQPGVVYRYTAAGETVDSFRVGINPGAFCWK